MTICNYSEKCSGCSLWGTPYHLQTQQKIENLKKLFKRKSIEMPNKIEFISFAEYGLRHRVDFTLIYDDKKHEHHFGFYDSNRNILDIENCMQMSNELSEFYKDFRTLRFFYNNDKPIKKGSIRLRVGPNGERGCWLDFANIDIKNLLQDQVLLLELLERGYHVEIGQKGKTLKLENKQLILNGPQALSYFKTLGPHNEILPLKCLVSEFTQPSWISASRMVEDVLKIIADNKKIQNILEFGSGIGQFTLGFLKFGCAVDVFEINPSSCERLQENVEAQHLQTKLKIHCGDYQTKPAESNANTDLVFVNPARSGLRKFVNSILKSQTQFVLYISCFPETMVEDLSQMIDQYEICNIIVYDQFPQTKHYETMIFLKKLI